MEDLQVGLGGEGGCKEGVVPMNCVVDVFEPCGTVSAVHDGHHYVAHFVCQQFQALGSDLLELISHLL